MNTPPIDILAVAERRASDAWDALQAGSDDVSSFLLAHTDLNSARAVIRDIIRETGASPMRVQAVAWRFPPALRVLESAR